MPSLRLRSADLLFNGTVLMQLEGFKTTGKCAKRPHLLHEISATLALLIKKRQKLLQQFHS